MRKPKFANPFILACHSRHAKLAGIGVVCLQRLVASRSLPSERLKDVLAGLKETTNMSELVSKALYFILTPRRPGYPTQNSAIVAFLAAALFQ